MTQDEKFLLQAAALATGCPPAERGFSVGAVLVKDGNIVATGYSREGAGNMHAEEIAIAKAREIGVDVKGTTIYSSLEPCHPRLSGKPSCTQLIIEAGIARVVFTLKEPPIFVECKGEETLRGAGLDVVHDSRLAAEVISANPIMAIGA